MHFRVRGSNVQVVRTVTDPKTLAAKSVPAGSANIRTGALSEELLAALSEAEVQEVRRWIEERQRIERLRTEVEAHFLDQRVLDAVRWLQSAPPEAARAVVPSALRAMKAFQRAAIERGFAERRARRSPKREGGEEE